MINETQNVLYIIYKTLFYISYIIFFILSILDYKTIEKYDSSTLQYIFNLSFYILVIGIIYQMIEDFDTITKLNFENVQTDLNNMINFNHNNITMIDLESNLESNSSEITRRDNINNIIKDYVEKYKIIDNISYNYSYNLFIFLIFYDSKEFTTMIILDKFGCDYKLNKKILNEDETDFHFTHNYPLFHYWLSLFLIMLFCRIILYFTIRRIKNKFIKNLTV